MRRAIVLLVTVLVVVLAGCGGDDSSKTSSKDEYGQQLAQAGATLQKTFADLGDATGSSTSSKQIGDRLEKGAIALDGSAKKFGAITPPSEVKAAHQKLVDGLEELADVFRKGAAAARKNDSATLTKALQGLATSDGVKKITEAQKELTAQGITVTTESP